MTIVELMNQEAASKKFFEMLDIANLEQHEVLIIGNLTSNPTINEDSNFMFGGAKITFIEA